MQLNLLDYTGIVIFLLITFIIYRRYWFYSYYSFIKFLLLTVISLLIGLVIASQNPFDSVLSNLQIALILQLVVFFVLWKVISFKKVFFTIDRHTLNVDRFLYLHKINKYVNIFPSLVASFFVSFLLFTLFLSVSVYSPFLQQQVNNSRVITDIPYAIYFAPVGFKDLRLFENVAFKIIPPVAFNPGESIDKLRESLAGNELEKINTEREKAGLEPIGALPYVPPSDQVGVPDTNEPPPSSDRKFIPPVNQDPPSDNNPVPTVIAPTATPIVIPNTPPPANNPQPTQIQNPIQQPLPTSTPIPNPTATPIPEPISNPSDLRAFEQRIFELTNEKRAENGLPPYTWSEEIAAVARAHSQDMKDRSYFNHISPDGVNPFQRLQVGGVSFSTAGENIAAGPTAEIMIRNWMNSSGHRANILSSRFGRIGIGVASNGRYGFLATQNFTN